MNGVLRTLVLAAIFQAFLPAGAYAAFDCKAAKVVFELGLDNHLTVHKMTPEIAGRVVARFEEEIKTSYANLLDGDDLKKLRATTQGAPLDKIAKDLMAGRCDFFVQAFAPVAEGFEKKLRPLFASVEELERILVGYTSEKGTDFRTRMLNDMLKTMEPWHKEVPILKSAHFVASRFFEFVGDLSQRMPEIPYLMLAKAFAKALDPHSDYLTSKQVQEYLAGMKPSYVGLGIRFQSHPFGPRVTTVRRGSAAALDGRIQTGDFLVAIDDIAVESLDLEVVQEKLIGPKNSLARVTYAKLRDGSLLPAKTISIKRREVEVFSLENMVTRHEIYGKSVLTIRMDDFYMGASFQILNALVKADEEKHVDALVLDLRWNNGGNLSEAARLVGGFITTGMVAQIIDRNGHVTEFEDKWNLVGYDGPIVVAVSNYTASAAEILAGSLQDYARAIVVGSPHTFGKGVTTQTFTAKNSPEVASDLIGGLTLTTARFYLAGGDSTQRVGVQSDIVVPGVSIPARLEERNLKYAIAGDSLHHPIYDWQAFRENADRKISTKLTSLRAFSSARMKVIGPPRDEKSQLSEIESIAADYAIAKEFIK